MITKNGIVIEFISSLTQIEFIFDLGFYFIKKENKYGKI